MSFLDKNGLQVLTNKLVQGDAIKVASHRGHTVKNVIDNITRECENVATPNTMTLENRVNEFKVGKGRDVDVSGDVEEGKIEVELQGKTWQNLCGSNAGVSIQYMDDYKIEDTEEYLKITRNAENYTGWFYFSNRTLKVNMLKPNTTYTVFFKYESINNNTPRLQFMLGNATQWLSDVFNSVRLKDNIYRCIIKTASSFEGKEVGNQVIYFHNTEPRKTGCFVTLYKNMLLLEGDYSDLSVEEIPSFFTNIKSSFEDGVVDIEVQGKNLVDLSKFNRASNAVSQVNIINNTISFSSSTRYNGVGQTFSEEEYKKMVGKYVTVSCGKITTSTGDSNDAYVFLKQSFVNSDGSTTWNNSTIASGQSKKIKILEGVDVTKFGIFVEPSNPVSGSIDIKAENIQLEIDSASASYEPYYKKKISFNIGEPLRSLPNGVCDEIRNDNGRWELVRRIGKANAVDIKHWYKLATYEKTILYRWHNGTYDGKYKAKPSCSGWCNTIPYYKPKGENDTAFCRINDVGPYGALVFAIEKSKLDQDNPDPTQWFSENPTTFYYQLADPIITQIEPIEFDIKPMANIYINSGDIYPISNHTVVLNRAGQIEQGILRIAELRKRVDNLETAYDSYLLETQHKLSILGFEYELESEEV